MSTNARSEEERQLSFVFNDLKRDINLDDTGLVDAESPTVSCQVGQRCTIKTDDQRKNYLVPAVYGQPKVITCHFDTSSPADVVFGLIDSGGQSPLSPISK
ncbi:hypothetical protein JR316_0012718 [Psilocybe cubensis]|uniref:Uncharacterized protein n=2 Tax=Psilocybe cubensis TaxID=181762 RepID=A0ACB8GK57_PSICU|nr:hypothetical protein JR316_0012718 [Psilocybe cubensis]KAH9475601.1 hypothetical protein JR316_0012718 [Psilocybe cubensis]